MSSYLKTGLTIGGTFVGTIASYAALSAFAGYLQAGQGDESSAVGRFMKGAAIPYFYELGSRGKSGEKSKVDNDS